MVENGHSEKLKAAAVMSALDFARLGDGQVAYVKQVDSDQVRDLFPTLTGLPEGINFYALLGADGTPLGLTDSRSSAIASAIENELEPVSVH
ncbi:hypothetical protein BMS3Bbin10_02848 [bacterium BMS3Bbin10]|nr:hypothetical protein BMS3Bbin10_02848 [bacterium BMS3Bbin10]